MNRRDFLAGAAALFTTGPLAVRQVAAKVGMLPAADVSGIAPILDTYEKVTATIRGYDIDRKPILETYSYWRRIPDHAGAENAGGTAPRGFSYRGGLARVDVCPPDVSWSGGPPLLPGDHDAQPHEGARD